MKRRTLVAGILTSLLVMGLSAQTTDQVTRFSAKSGSKMRIEGTANMIHTHWAAESTLLGGWMEAGPNFPITPGQAVSPGKVNAAAEVFITVRSLKSVDDKGQHYEDKMDDIMYEKLLPTNASPKISFSLTELTLKEAAKSKEDPYLFEAKGNLAVAAVTNAITMPLKVLPLGEKKLKISGTASVKMSEFKIDPPVVKILGLKTGDEVKLIFDWMLIERPAQAAAAGAK